MRLVNVALLAGLALAASCGPDPPTGPGQAALAGPYEPDPAAAVFGQEPGLARYGFDSRVAWGRTYAFAIHNCMLTTVDLYTLDTGTADIYIYRGTADPSGLIMKRPGWHLGRIGWHTWTIPGNILGGYDIKLWTVVSFAADHSRKPLVYIPGPAPAGQSVSADGVTWQTFAAGEIALRLHYLLAEDIP
jgi:hypothetical protein